MSMILPFDHLLNVIIEFDFLVEKPLKSPTMISAIKKSLEIMANAAATMLREVKTSLG